MNKDIAYLDAQESEEILKTHTRGSTNRWDGGKPVYIIVDNRRAEA